MNLKYGESDIIGSVELCSDDCNLSLTISFALGLKKDSVMKRARGD
jgi:hypothetical protein